MDPLFDDTPAPKKDENSYVLPRSDKKHLKPTEYSDNAAVQMLRHKLDAIYNQEPDVKKESVIAEHATAGHRSKHQQFMHNMTNSGRSMAEIQSAWHEYYSKLSDREKHEVWQEFYQANATSRAAASVPRLSAGHAHNLPQHSATLDKPVISVHAGPEEDSDPKTTKSKRRRSVNAIKKQVVRRVRASASAQAKAKQHLQSLVFGIGMGVLALLIAMFGLFNEMIVTPFIRPANASATPIILSADGPAPSSAPEVIIPKINAQLPVVYNGESVAEEEVQKALESGVYHYPTTATPGQNGNVAIFGHSSNNIFNKGKYKFAFVLLHELEPGDIFYLTSGGKVYTYKVFTKKVVTPDETWVLSSTEGKTATAALITCDPPGSTRHRLVVWGEQISPDPSTNTATAEPSEELQEHNLPGKAQSWLTRLNPFD